MAPCSIKQRTVFTSVMVDGHEMSECVPESLSNDVDTRKHLASAFATLPANSRRSHCRHQTWPRKLRACAAPTRESTTLKNLSFRRHN